MKEKEKAFEARILYNKGAITRKEAEEMIAPYKAAFDKKSKELAEKYHVRPQRFSMAAFLR